MRSKPSTPRKIVPDPIYGHTLVTKLINRVMHDGKKSVAEKQVHMALQLLGEKSKQEPLAAFIQAVDNIKPQMEVRPRRIGGAVYQVPSPVRGSRQDSLAIRWLVLATQDRSNSDYHTFAEKLAAELLDALNNAGGAIKKKVDTHRMAEANKAFAHFKW